MSREEEPSPTLFQVPADYSIKEGPDLAREFKKELLVPGARLNSEKK
jgi:hypothetical protein